jgi:hypothetical protein
MTLGGRGRGPVSLILLNNHIILFNLLHLIIKNIFLPSCFLDIFSGPPPFYLGVENDERRESILRSRGHHCLEPAREQDGSEPMGPIVNRLRTGLFGLSILALLGLVY